MATLILRPVSDVSSEHSKSSGSSAYSLLNEASQDGDTTYIYQTVSSTSTVTKNTVCKVGGTAPNRLYYVSQSVATVVGKVDDTSSSSTKNIIVAIRTSASGSDMNKVTTRCNTTTYTSYSTGNSSEGRGYYEAGTLPNLWILAATSGSKGTAKSGNKQIRITQAYITLTINDAYVCRAIAVGGCTAEVNNEYSAGVARTWTATLQDGYNFVGWLDETNYQAYQNGNSYSVLTTDLTYTSGTISQDMTLYAVAVLPQHTATIHNSVGGVVMFRFDADNNWTTIASGQTSTITGSGAYHLRVVPQSPNSLSKYVPESNNFRTTVEFDSYIFTLENLDEQGNTTQKTVYDIVAQKEYKYDENGDLVSEKEDTTFTTDMVDSMRDELISANGTAGNLGSDFVASFYYKSTASRLFANVNGTWRKVVCIYQKSETEWVSVASDGTHINEIGQEVLEQFGNGGYIVIPKSDE